VSEPGAAPQVPTRALEPAELDDLAGLELCPMLFQERLDKTLELRLTVVGRRIFTAAVDPQGAVDVRMEPDLLRALRPFDGLPAAFEQRLLSLCTRLGLNFATADAVYTRDGRWVLLEVNSISFFDHVEAAAGLPISDAVARLLLGLDAPQTRAP
jgi:hypothetical protein